jgi:hypothetical protein
VAVAGPFSYEVEEDFTIGVASCIVPESVSGIEVPSYNNVSWDRE